MSKMMIALSLVFAAGLAQAQATPTRVELAHKCFYNGEYSSAGQGCVNQSRQLKQLNIAGAPIQIQAACTEILDLGTWQELGCPGGHGSPTEGGYYLEAYIETNSYNAVKGQAVELASVEKYKLFNCEESAQMYRDYSTAEVTVSALCQKSTPLTNKIVTTIELK